MTVQISDAGSKRVAIPPADLKQAGLNSQYCETAGLNRMSRLSLSNAGLSCVLFVPIKAN